MKIIVTVREVLDNGIWDKLCDLKGINVWAVNEGLIDDTEEIILNEKEAKLLGILASLEVK